MKVLITGAAGFIVSTLARRLLDRGDEVIVTEFGFIMHRIYAAHHGAQVVFAKEKNFKASVDDILKLVVNRIKEDMKNYPQMLKELNKEKEKFHIHDYEFGTILISGKESIFYICSHC